MAMLFAALYFTQELGFNVILLSWLLAAFGAGSVIGSYGAGRLSTWWPAQRLLVASMVGSCCAFLMLSKVTAPLSIAAVMLFAGIFEGAFRPSYNRIIMLAFPREEWRGIYSIYLVAVNLGVAVAGTVGGMLAGFGYDIVFVSNGLMSLLAAAITIYAFRTFRVISRNPESNADEVGAPMGGRSPFRDATFVRLCLATLLSAFVFCQIRSTYPAYLSQEYGIDPKELGYLFALNGLMIVALQVPLTMLAKRMSNAILASVGCILLCAGFAVLPIGSTFAFIILSLIVWTIGEILLFPALNAMVGERASFAATGHFLGIYHAQYSIANLFAPALGGYIYGHLSGDALWYACGLVGLVGAALIVVPDSVGKRS